MTEERRVPVRFDGVEYPYTITPNGDVYNEKGIKLKHINGSGGNLYVNLYANGLNSLSIKSIVYSSYTGRSVQGRHLELIDGNLKNVSLPNIRIHERYRHKYTFIDDIDHESINKKDEIENNKIEPVKDSSLAFAEMQLKIIKESNNFNLLRRIRRHSVIRTHEMRKTLTENSSLEHDLEYILNAQKTKSIHDLPLFNSPNLIHIYNEYGDILPVIDDSNIRELLTIYITDMTNNILVRFEYEMTDDKIITLTAIESDNLKYTLHIDERHPIRSWLDIIRLRGMLMMYYDGADESFHM